MPGLAGGQPVSGLSTAPAILGGGQGSVGSTRSTSSPSTALFLTAMRSDIRSLSGPARERELRQLVTRLKGCLPALAPQAERVLVLRAGLGLKHPYSAVQVARALHLTLTREGLIEDSALLTLQSVAQTDGCEGSGSGDGLLSDAALLGSGPSLSAFAPASLVAAGVAAPSGVGSHGAGAAGKSRPTHPQSTAVYKASVAAPSPGPGGSSWPLVFIPLAVVALLAAAALRLRRAQLAPAAAQAETTATAAQEAPFAASSAPAFNFALVHPEQAEESAEQVVPAQGNGASEPPLPVPRESPPPSAPVVSGATGTALEKRTPQRSWLRQHSSQLAIVLTALGGAARLLIRTRHNGGRRRRSRVG